MALFEELISQSDVPVEFSIKAVAPLMEKTLNSAFLNHPGLLRSVLESEGHNPMARTLIQRIVIARVAKIIKEKDRISRIQQVITDQLMDNQKKFANFVAEYSDPLQGKTNILQTTILDSLTSEFSLSKDKVQYTIRLKSNAVKIRLPTLPEQKV
jgi:hypothetical protein